MDIRWHYIKEEGLPKRVGNYLFCYDFGDIIAGHYQPGDDEKYSCASSWAEIPVPEKPRSELVRNGCNDYPTCDGCPLTEYCKNRPIHFSSLLDYVRRMVKDGKELLKKYGESEE